MVVPTVSNAKNRMRRVITAIVDPWPKDEQPIWDHFSSRCAYCGVELDWKGRKAHMDHATVDGGNHLGNLILSCATCNGDEKLGEQWQDFLARKVPDAEIRATRSRRIEQWMALHPATPRTPSPEVEALVLELEAIVDAFGAKCAELRKIVGPRTHRSESLAFVGRQQGTPARSGLTSGRHWNAGRPQGDVSAREEAAGGMQRIATPLWVLIIRRGRL